MKPVCPPCQRFMRPKKNGVCWVECKPTGGWDGERGKDSKGWTNYKLWFGDLYECQGCRAQTIVGSGMRPIAEHYPRELCSHGELL